MDAYRCGLRRERRVWFSPVLLAAVLFPALMQATCARTGDTTLTVLEFEVGGANRVQFSSSQRSYDVSSPGSPAIVRVQSTDPGAQLSYNFWDDNGLIEGGPLGIGSAEVTLAVPDGVSGLAVYVKAPQGASDFYLLNIFRIDAPPPDVLPKPLALDCALQGTDLYLPVDLTVQRDRVVLIAGPGFSADVTASVLLPSETFCPFVGGGNPPAVDVTSATMTVVINGVSQPVPSRVTLSGSALPITNIDVAAACGGAYGAGGPNRLRSYDGGSLAGWCLDGGLLRGGRRA